jgi:putative heme iron utilization protein
MDESPHNSAGALFGEGHSFVTVAFDNGNPIFLISGLAEHTKNLERDPRASLLEAEGGSADPLANGRVTMLGRCTRVEEDGGSARAAFFAAHPNSTYYADFRDFAFWKLDVDYVRYIGGYGRMSWISQADWRAAERDPLDPSAAGMIAHMNADHADAMVLYCKAFSHGTEITSASMTGVDRYGFEMSAITSRGPRPVRGVRQSGQHAGGSARHSDLHGEGRQIQAGRRSSVSVGHRDRAPRFSNCGRMSRQSHEKTRMTRRSSLKVQYLRIQFDV